MDRELDPCIIFSFSKKDCETYAMLMSRLDFNSDEEKELISAVYTNAIDALSGIYSIHILTLYIFIMWLYIYYVHKASYTCISLPIHVNIYTYMACTYT